jgi:hypothetical protein
MNKGDFSNIPPCLPYKNRLQAELKKEHTGTEPVLKYNNKYIKSNNNKDVK